MGDPSRFQFQTDAVAEQYDRTLVPRLFLPWAERLLSLVPLAPGECAVDVATGTGVVARLAARRVGSKGSVWAVDPSPNMLRVARSKLVEAGSAPIRYLEAPAERLGVPDKLANAVFCQQGLQFFADQPAGLAEMLRVLRPGGKLALAVWGPLARNTLFAAWHEALTRAGLDSLADLLTAPYSLPKPTVVTGMVRSAGFAIESVVTEARPMTLEGGLEQAVAALGATAVGEPLARIGAELRARYENAARGSLSALVRGGAVQAESLSTLLVARA